MNLFHNLFLITSKTTDFLIYCLHCSQVKLLQWGLSHLFKQRHLGFVPDLRLINNKGLLKIGDFGRVWLPLSIFFYLLSQYFIKSWTNEKSQEFYWLSRQTLFGQHSHNVAVYMLIAVTLCKPLFCQLKSVAQVCLG